MELLLSVVTISEAVYHWQRRRCTIERAINTGKRLPRLAARQSPDRESGTWLITVESLRARWGDPVIPLPELSEF